MEKTCEQGPRRFSGLVTFEKLFQSGLFLFSLSLSLAAVYREGIPIILPPGPHEGFGQSKDSEARARLNSKGQRSRQHASGLWAEILNCKLEKPFASF